MGEANRTIEVFLSQLDKRLSTFEQNLLELRGEMGHLREEVAAQIRDVRGEMGQLREEVAAPIRDLRTEMREELRQIRGEIAQVRTEVGEELRQVRGEIAQVRGEIAQVRGEMEAIRAEGRSHLRWSLAAMFTLFGAATPLWMWVLSRIIK